MKQKISILFFLMAIAAVSALFMQCKPKAEEPAPAKMEKVDTSGPEYTSKYICPMFCKGSGSDQPGVCPVCGMDYVLNENLDEPDEQEHNHDHSDSTHSH
ncbi:MAG: hypothetical protein IPM34_05220 [Saprospiraceae bacterium]|nr:hypothetical protein [Saprospiraceae bacterium]